MHFYASSKLTIGGTLAEVVDSTGFALKFFACQLSLSLWLVTNSMAVDVTDSCLLVAKIEP